MDNTKGIRQGILMGNHDETKGILQGILMGNHDETKGIRQGILMGNHDDTKGIRQGILMGNHDETTPQLFPVPTSTSRALLPQLHGTTPTPFHTTPRAQLKQCSWLICLKGPQASSHSLCAIQTSDHSLSLVDKGSASALAIFINCLSASHEVKETDRRYNWIAMQGPVHQFLHA
eukprot:1155540-Pelagomonas_calceolata.AAC.4